MIAADLHRFRDYYLNNLTCVISLSKFTPQSSPFSPPTCAGWIDSTSSDLFILFSIIFSISLIIQLVIVMGLDSGKDGAVFWFGEFYNTFRLSIYIYLEKKCTGTLLSIFAYSIFWFRYKVTLLIKMC